MIGIYDAAVIDQEDGKPHIVKRRPPRRPRHPGGARIGYRAPREVHDAAQALGSGEAGLIVVGEPTLEKGFDKAVTRAAKTVKRDLNAATDELAKELTEAFKG